MSANRTIGKRIIELILTHGSLSKAARAIRVDKAYLLRISTGEKTNPSKNTLRKMGLREVKTYERVNQ